MRHPPAGALAAKVADFLAQFCVETDVCALAQNDRNWTGRDQSSASLYNPDGERFYGDAAGRAITIVNWQSIRDSAPATLSDVERAIAG